VYTPIALTATSSTLEVQDAVDQATAQQVPITLAAGEFDLRNIVVRGSVSIRGAGPDQTEIYCAGASLFDYQSPTKLAFAAIGGMSIRGDAGVSEFALRIGGAGATYTTFHDLLIRDCRVGIDVTAAPTGAAGAVNWCGFNDISFRGGFRYGIRFQRGSGTGNTFHGGKQCISQPEGAVFAFQGDGCEVGDLLFHGLHVMAENGVTDAAVIQVGANTKYRNAISMSGSQIDATLTRPFDLSPIGPKYTNVRLGASNNLGGNTNLPDTIPPLYSGVMEGKDISAWRQAHRETRSGVGPARTRAFRVDLAPISGTVVTVSVVGAPAGAGSSAAYAQFLLRSGVNNTTVLQIAHSASGRPDTNFVITPVTDGLSTYFEVSWVAAIDGITDMRAQLETSNGTVRVQTGQFI
jgi:hypothetical protein